MLFIYEGQFVEVVRENCYQSLLTICSNDVSVLTQLADGTGTMGEPVELHNQNFGWAIHVPYDRSVELVERVPYKDIEVTDRLTGPPLAYAYDYLPMSESIKEEGNRWGEYGYCWPDEITDTRAALYGQDDPPDSEVVFVPIFTIPAELSGAPRPHIDADEDLDFE